jgi:hypothetical protein
MNKRLNFIIIINTILATLYSAITLAICYGWLITPAKDRSTGFLDANLALGGAILVGLPLTVWFFRMAYLIWKGNKSANDLLVSKGLFVFNYYLRNFVFFLYVCYTFFAASYLCISY